MKKRLFLTVLFTISNNLYANNVRLEASEIYSLTGYATNLRSSPSSVYIISANEIEEKKYTSLSEILASVPTISISEGQEPEVDLRGQGYQKARATVQLLIDGIPANLLDTSHRKVPLNTLNPKNIERIEVIPGGGAVLYGNGATGGVINIITKSAKKNSVNLSYQYGSFGDNKYNVFAESKLGKFDFIFDYSKDDRNGYSENSNSEADYFSMKLKYNFNEKDNINIKYKGYKKEFYEYGLLTKKQLEENRKQNGIPENEKKLSTREGNEFSLNYNAQLGENNELNIAAFMSETKYKTKIFKNFNINQISKSKDIQKSIKIKDKFTYGADSNLILGLGYTEHNMNIARTDVNKTTLEAFLINTYKFGEKFEFSQGFRYDRAKYEGAVDTRIKVFNNMEKKMQNFSASLALNYLYSDTGNAYLKYERAFNTPAPLQSIKAEKGVFSESEAKAEKSNTYELGIRDYVEPLNSTISASIYHSETTDELKTIWTSGRFHDTNNFETKNIGKTRRYGFDLKAEQVFGKLKLTEAYSYIDAKTIKSNNLNENGKYIDNVPKHKFLFSTDYDINTKFSVGLTYQYHAPYYIDLANKYGKTGEKSLLNFRINYKLNENFDIYAGIKNLLNKKYNDAVIVRRGEILYNPAPSRNYYVGFNIKF